MNCIYIYIYMARSDIVILAIAMLFTRTCPPGGQGVRQSFWEIGYFVAAASLTVIHDLSADFIQSIP